MSAATFPTGWARAAADLEARIQIAVVARVDARHEILFAIREQLEACGGWVEAQQAQRGGALMARRDVEGQAFHGHPPFARRAGR